MNLSVQNHTGMINNELLEGELEEGSIVGDNERKSNIIIESPKIKIEENSIGIYMDLPEQKIKEAFGDCIEWQLIYNGDYEKSLIVQADFYKRADDFISEEKIVILPPAEKYTVNLYVNNEKVDSWDFEGILDKKVYMCFDQNRNLVCNGPIPREKVIFVYSSEHILENSYIQSLQLECFAGWEKFKFYILNIKDEKLISLSKLGNKTRINIDEDVKPRFISGKKLFGLPGSQFEYYQLPYVKIHDDGNLTSYQISIADENNKSAVVQKSLKEVGFIRKNNFIAAIIKDSLIAKGEFGVYNVEVSRDNQVVFREKLYYLPPIDISHKDGKMWPVGINGYQANNFLCRLPDDIELKAHNIVYKAKYTIEDDEFDELYKADEECDNYEEYDKYEDCDEYSLNNKTNFIKGNMCLKTKNINIPFKKNIRPVMWQWMDGRNIDVDWPCEIKKFSIKSFDQSNNADDNFIFTVNQNEYECLNIYIKLVDGKQNAYPGFKCACKNDKIQRFYMSTLLKTIRSVYEDVLYIIMEIKDDQGKHLSECILAIIQDEVNISEYCVAADKGNLVVSWQETGSKRDREMLIYNLSFPYEEAEIYPIEDGQTTLMVENFKDKFSKGKYGIVAGHIDENRLYGENGMKILALGNIKKTFSIKIGEKAECNEIDKLLSYINESVFDKKAIEKFMVESFAEPFSKELCLKLSLNYLFLRKNFAKDRKSIYESIFNSLFEKYSENDKYIILKELIKIGLSKKYFELLVIKWGLLAISACDKCLLTINERKYLWGNMPILGFLVDLRTIPINKPEAASKITSMLSGMADYIPNSGENLIDYLTNNLWDKNGLNEVFQIDEKIIGNKNAVNRYFEFSFSQARKNMSRVRDESLYMSYCKNNLNDGVEVYGKTYLEAYLEWNKKTGREKSVDFEKKLNTMVNRLNFNEDIAKVKNVVNENILNLIKLRMDDKNTKFEYCGFITYLNSLYAYKNIKSKNINKLMKFIYQHMGNIAVRDIVIFEIYNRINLR